ncbi:MAG: aminopeptidase N [Hyphomicrobiaceae bacterium]|nr:aminopeptidase N [Hyphomicrobiaceae bacterium]
MRTDIASPIRLKDYRPPDYLIDTVDLEIALDATQTRVRSRLTVRANPDVVPAARKADKPRPLVLDGLGLKLTGISINGKPVDRKAYRVGATQLTLLKPPSDRFKLEITTEIAPETNKALQGLYLSRGVYCTQCEAEGFRRITYFLDRPDVLSVYTCRLVADRESVPVLLSNGNLVERGTLDRGIRHYATWHDPHPKPCYLFAAVGGDLGSIASTFKTMSGREVELAIYVERGKEERAHWAMDSLKRSMAWDERRFGREYDLDVFNIVAVSDFNMGAMENKGLNVFNDRLILASAETATDTMFEAIESVVAHEYFHNWTGNRITCRDWFQLCLKEGLTVYRDQEFSADERSPVVQRITDVRALRASQFPEDQGPMAHPVRPDSYVEINNFYTATVYEKGAEVVRMIEVILGRATFRRGLDLYFDRHDGQAATIEQFLTCFEEVSGRNLSQVMRWYEQAGTPHVTAEFAYDRRTRTARLDLTQRTPPTPGQTTKLPVPIPVRMGLLGPDGRDIPLQLETGEIVGDGIVHLTEPAQSFVFVGVPARPTPSLFRGFSAPVVLDIELKDKDLSFLVAHDSDGFNRWQAAYTYGLRVLVKLAEAHVAGRRSSEGTGYIDALGAALADRRLDWAFKAELMRLPSEGDIAREFGQNVDPSAIHAAHRQLAARIGKRLGPQLEAIHTKLRQKRFETDAKSAGARAARNAALTLLVARRGPEDIARTSAHYFKAASMTEAAHALALLCAAGTPEADVALAHFRERWHHDHLVIDTWFAVQALAPLPGTLERVEALLSDPLFNIETPNKARALIGTFAFNNPAEFNRPDGAGYQFLATQILTIDAFNPQIAARLLTALRSWRTLEAKRRRLARKALTRVAEAAKVSRDVGEVVGRLIAE